MMKLTVVGVVLAIGLVVAFGLYLFGIGLRNVGRAVASSRWPRTAGKVVRSGTQVQRDIDKKTRDVSVIYSADTVIQYEVAGKQYATNLIHFGQTLVTFFHPGGRRRKGKRLFQNRRPSVGEDQRQLVGEVFFLSLDDCAIVFLLGGARYGLHRLPRSQVSLFSGSEDPVQHSTYR